MGKKNFDRKKAVRFSLVPGPIVDGKPTVLYKPVQTRNSKVSKKQRKEVVSQMGDIEEVKINGKVVDENELPAYVLQQIRGRGDLIYNQMKGMKEEQEGDMYEIQDARQGDEQYEQYEIEEYDLEEKSAIRQQQHDYSSNQDQWEDDEEGNYSEGQVEQVEIEDDKVQNTKEKFETKVEQFPTIQQIKTVNIEGKDYQLTKKQIDMLDIVIPQNYEDMDFGGLQFKKYNEDGLPLSEKAKYQKYLLGQNEKVVVIDSYDYVPPKPIDTYDTDLSPTEINKDSNLKEIEQALNYNGDEVIYQEMEDDFFTKMIQMELAENQQTNKPKTIQKTEKQANKQKIVSKPKQKKQSVKQVKKDIPELSEKQLEQQLKKAVYNFEHNIQEKKDKQMNESSDEEDQEDTFSRNNHSMNFADLDKRQQYRGNDGELDWRCLTRKQKKQYMKTKIIQDFYDELRNRQIQQKLQGKNNVKVQELHLKQLIRHIPYQQDLVMQKALEQDLKKEVHLSDEEEDYQSLSEDDIVSFHQKTSIIASNLSIIEQPRNKTKKVKKQDQQQPEQHNLTKTKVVSEKRDKNQTPEQRKARKEKLREMKKQRKQQKKEFAQRFSKIKRETHKITSTTNPLNKVSYVKIY